MGYLRCGTPWVSCLSAARTASHFGRIPSSFARTGKAGPVATALSDQAMDPSHECRLQWPHDRCRRHLLVCESDTLRQSIPSARV